MFRLLRITRLAGLVALTGFFLAPRTAGASPLAICFSDSAAGNCSTPATTTATAGQSFDLFMLVDGALDLNVWSLFGQITWDSAHLSLASVTQGSFLVNGPTTCDAGTGPPCSTYFDSPLLTLNSASAMGGGLVDGTAGASGTGALAVFHFTALSAIASSQILFDDLNFPPALFLQDSAVQFFEPVTINASLQIDPVLTGVPEPGTMMLLATGLVTVAGRWRATRRRPA